VTDLTLPTDKKGKRSGAGAGREGRGQEQGSGRAGGKEPDLLGTLLHNVYDATLAEQTPPEMLDLLGKLI
jgi:hypothetical protein